MFFFSYLCLPTSTTLKTSFYTFNIFILLAFLRALSVETLEMHNLRLKELGVVV